MMGTILCNLVDLVVRMSIVDFEMRCSGDEKGYLEKKVVGTICNFFSPTTRETGFPESQSAVDTFLWFIRSLEDEGNAPAYDDGHGTNTWPLSHEILIVIGQTSSPRGPCTNSLSRRVPRSIVPRQASVSHQRSTEHLPTPIATTPRRHRRPPALTPNPKPSPPSPLPESDNPQP